MNHLSMNNLTVETEDAFASLLDLAANNDLEGCKKFIDREPSSIHEVGHWYGRQKGSKHMVLQQRTPLMVASTYGSLDVLKLILSLPETDVNQSCGADKTTALHCAASGGSANAIDVVKLLLAGGADPNLVDADGLRSVDLVVVSPNFQETRSSLEKLLMTDASFGDHNLRVSTSNPPSLSPSPENRSPSSTSDSTSPKNAKFNDIPVSYAPEKKEYPIDPSLPDIKNSIYSTDEFRMYSFKVRPCSRAYSHDWTECPFVHPGENARRRDPRKFHYSCVPCPEFRKGSCRRGDMCEYAHGVFECWLHPAQYRTRLCKDGTSCNRRVCFFAHTQEELRPLYHSTGSAVPSPGSSPANGMDFLLPGSPSSVSVMSPSPFTPPMSPSGSGMGWQQPNVPALHLSGSNFQSSRLRSSFNARDIHYEDMTFLSDFDGEQQLLLNDLSRLSHPSASTNSLNRSARSKTTLTPSNLEDLFSAESLSPRYCDQMTSTVFSPTHKSAILNQFQQQPMNTNFFSKNVDHPLLQATFGASSSGRMSPRNVDPISPMSARTSLLAQHQFRSLSSRDLGSTAADENWSKWSSFTAKPDWATTPEELARLKRASSFDLRNNGEEPDLSWVQTLVKECPQDMKEKAPPDVSNTAGVGESSSDGPGLNSQIDQIDPSSLRAWLEQMQLDQLVAQ